MSDAPRPDPRSGTSPRALLRNGASTLLRSALGWGLIQGLGALLSVLLARHLGEGYGRLGLALLVSTLACQLCQWGLDPLIVRDLARADGDTRRTSRILGNLLHHRAMAVLLAALFGTGLALLWPQQPERGLIFLAVVDGMALAMSLPAAFDVRERTWLYVTFGAVRQLCYAGALVAFFLLRPEQLTPLAVLGIHLGCVLLQISLEWLWISARYGTPKWDGARGDAYWNDGTWTALGLLSVGATLASGPFALEWLSGGRDIASAVVANQWIVAGVSLLQLGLRPALARLSADSAPLTRRYAGVVLRRAVLAAVLGLVGGLMTGGAFSAVLPRLYPPAFEQLGTLVLFEAARMPALLALAVLHAGLVAQNRLRAVAVSAGAGLAACVVLQVLLTPAYGAPAAALVPCAGLLVAALAAGVLLRRGLDEEPSAT